MALLLEAHADIEAAHSSGSTPLIQAAIHGRAQSVGLLVRAGANVHARCLQRTALQWAMQGNHHACVELLHMSQLEVKEVW